MIPNKRAMIARALQASGVLSLIERTTGRPGLLVLTYHRIGDPSGHPFYAQVASATPEALREELIALARTRRILTLPETIAFAQDGFRGAESTALVTFDDGYRDNHDAALPVLTTLGVPATFFLTTGFVAGKILPWWDHVAYVVNNAGVPVLKLNRPTPIQIDLIQEPRTAAVMRVIRAYLDHPEVDERPLRVELEQRAEVAVDEPRLARSLFMTWEQARTLARAGMSIGSHTMTHRALGRLNEDDQSEELTGSKAILEAELGQTPEAVAYPYGWPGTYGEPTIRLVRKAGYRAGFSSTEGLCLTRPSAPDVFSLPRLGVGFADPPVLHRARWALWSAFGKSPV